MSKLQMSGYFPIPHILRFDMDPELPDAGHSLPDAIVLAVREQAHGVADESGNIVCDRDRCERLFDLAQDLKNIRDNFPAELLAKKRWVLWKPAWDESKQKFRKPPYSPIDCKPLEGKLGSPEREAHYVTFDDAEAAALKYELKVGINLTAVDGYVVVDFDDAIKGGVTDPDVLTWLKWLPSYTEYSASGRGLHVLGRGEICKKLDARPVGQATVELFHNSFIACTGLIYGGDTDVRLIQAGVNKMLGAMSHKAAEGEAGERPMSERTARKFYQKNLDALRDAPQGAGNSTLNAAAFFAGRAFAADVLEGTENQIKGELRRIVTMEWRNPHPQPGADQTIESGWSSGIGKPLAIREDTELEEKIAEYNDERGYCVIQNYGGKARVVWFEMDEHPDFSGRWQLAGQSFEEFKKAHLNEWIELDGEAKLFPEVWLKSPARRQYAKVTFQPERSVEDCLNLWRGWAAEPQKGDCQFYFDHLHEVVCGGDRKHYEYTVKWMAYAVRHPNERGHSALVWRGPKGAGKNMACDGFGKLWGQHYLVINNAEHFLGRFNHHLRDTSVLCANEAFFAGNKQHEAALKALVTDPMMPVEQKFVDLQMCPNLLHVLVISNSDWVVPASTDERRYFVLDVSGSRVGDKAYFSRLAAEVDRPNPYILWHLLNDVDLTGFDPRFVPTTKALLSQMSEGLEGAEAAWFECLYRGELPGQVFDGGAEKGVGWMRGTDFIKWADSQRRRKWSGITDQKLGYSLGENSRGRQKGMGFKKARDDKKIFGDDRAQVWRIGTLVEAREAWSEKRFQVDWDTTTDAWRPVPMAF